MPPKRRRRFQGLYYHSSPPKVFSMNGKSPNPNLGKRRDVDDFSIKLSTIRIWMHEKDIGKLTRVLWAGQGNRLRQQASNNSKVKRFLAAVPHAMNSIKDVHQAVIDNNLETLQTYLEPPVPPALITCKDANGLNVLHKAAGLGHAKILEYLIGVWPDGVQETDITGKTPLHWAASCKNNMRCYTLLTEAGADEEALDYKMKSPSYYRHKPNEIERAFLAFVPEAPRVAPDVATDWEALAEDSSDSRKIRIPEAMINGLHDPSHDNASEPDVVKGEGEKPEEGGQEEKQEKSVQGDQDVDDNNGDVRVEAGDDKKEDDDQIQVNPQIDEDKPQELDDYKDHGVNEDDPQNDDDNAQIDKDEDHDPLEAEGESQLEDKNDTNEENISNDLSQATKTTTTPTKITTNMADGNETEGDNNQENGDQQDLKETIQKNDDKNPIEADADENVEGEIKKQDEDNDRKENENEKEDVKNTVDNETHESEESTKTIEENEKSGITNNETKSDVITESPGENNGVDEEGKKKHEEREAHETKDEQLKEDTNVDPEENMEQEVKKGDEMKGEEVKEEEANKEEETKDDTDTGDEEKKVPVEQLTKSQKDINEDGKEEEGEEDEENSDSRKGRKSANEDSQVINNNESEKKPEELINQDEESRKDIEEEEAESNTKDVDVGGHEESSILTEKTDNEKGMEKSTEPDSDHPLLENNEAIEEGERETEEETSDTSEKDHQMAEGSGVVHQKNEENKKRSQSALKKEKSGTRESGQSSKRPQTHKMKAINGNKKSSIRSEIEKEDDEKNADKDNDGTSFHHVHVVAGSDDDDDDDQDKKIKADVKAELWYGEVKADILADHQHEEKADSVSVNSITSSLAIEGFVQGEPEDNIVESLFAADVHEEKKDSRSIQDIIASGNMEQLAQIVLNGDGNKLLNMQSKEQEIQAFLYNVPNYMNKIRRVHVAAREGDIMGLQKALDRRKFAIAKDEISPNGASPLHVAVLFGHSDIVRYLATRFPETTTATDDDGRTALHYAATIKDNGHFYNVLTQFGANPKSVDKFGHSPEYFLDIKESNDILTYRQLLEFFGAAELEAELLSDQVPDDLHSSRRLLPDGNAAVTLDRCFNVIQESSKVLSGATASALSHRKPLSSSAVQISVTSYLSRFLKPSVYAKIRKRQTRLDHNLFDVIWPAMRRTTGMRHLEEDINCGIVAPDFDVYVVFQEFLVPLIKDMHCLSITSDFKPHPRLAYFPMENGERLNTASFVFDEDSDLLHRCVVECSRNLDRFELPLNLSIGQIEQAERLMMSKIFNANFRQVIGDKESGNYYTLSEIVESDSEVRSMLASFGLMIPLLDSEDSVQAAESTAFNGSIWPYGRGVFVSVQNNLALWLNCQEHLRVIATTPASSPGDLGAAYTRVGRAVCYLERELHFRESYLLGYLQARPSYLGTGLKMYTTLRLPNLMKEMDNLRHLCSVRGLSLITKRSKNPAVRLVNMQSLNTVEYVLFQDYCTAVTNILSLEKDMSLSNSKHIATMLVKIFRRKVDKNYLETNPLFKTEQGKYLVSTLAEPLTKALTEIAKIRPPDPVTHLATFLQKYGYTNNNNNNNSRRNKKNINNKNTPSPPSRGRINHTSLFHPTTPIAIKSLSAAKTLTGGGGSGESGVGAGSGGERVAASNIGDVHASHNGNLENGTLQSGIKDNSNNNFDQIEEQPEAAVADGSSSPKLEERDDHGQSMLHFANARSHRRGGLLHLIEESKIDITYRDELYRTARDVSLQANQPANAMEIDRYVLSLAVVGDVAPFEHFGAAGYDHIIDVVSIEGDNIIDVAVSRGHNDLVDFLQNIRSLEEQREELHEAIRENKIDRVVELTAGSNGKWLISAKNYYGRTALHIAVLKESEEIVEHFVNMCPQALKIGDNLERSALHYAMGTNAVETISRMLIQKGARRTSKDLKGRQPSYYFINKADILRLQEEEDESR